MGSVMKRANGRTVIQWTDGSGRQRQQVVVAAGQDGRPLSDRATEQLARRRLAELEEQGRRQRLGLEPLRAESLSMTFGALGGPGQPGRGRGAVQGEPRPKKVLAVDEFEQVLAEVPRRWEGPVATGLYAGLREGERALRKPKTTRNRPSTPSF